MLRSTNRAYVFPDVNSDQEGTSVGVMLDRMPKEELEELNHVRTCISVFLLKGGTILLPQPLVLFSHPLI